MKEKIYLLLVSLFVAFTVSGQDELIISNFDDVSPVFESWDTKGVDVVVNPLSDAINPSDSALQVFTSELVGWEGVKTLPEPLDFTNLKQFSVLVYSEMEGQILLKLEGDGVSPFEQRNNYTEEGTWQEITFDLSTATSNVYTLIALFPDIDGTSDSTAWFFDEIKLKKQEVVIEPSELNKITFETEGADYDWVVFDNTTADNDINAFTIVDNPDPSGVNTSSKVGKYEMHVGAAMWAGVKTNELDPVVITEETRWLIIDVYKTDMDTVGLKLEPPSTNGVLVTTVPETSGEWETLAFDFIDAIGDTFPTFVIFPDWTGLERSEETIYIDNIEWSPTNNRVVAINNNQVQPEVALFPNPASETLCVSANGWQLRQIEMFDILGNTVFLTGLNQEKYRLDVSSFERGIYILNVTSGSGQQSSMKVILR